MRDSQVDCHLNTVHHETRSLLKGYKFDHM